VQAQHAAQRKRAERQEKEDAVLEQSGGGAVDEGQQEQGRGQGAQDVRAAQPQGEPEGGGRRPVSGAEPEEAPFGSLPPGGQQEQPGQRGIRQAVGEAPPLGGARQRGVDAEINGDGAVRRQEAGGPAARLAPREPAVQGQREQGSRQPDLVRPQRPAEQAEGVHGDDVQRQQQGGDPGECGPRQGLGADEPRPGQRVQAAGQAEHQGQHQILADGPPGPADQPGQARQKQQGADELPERDVLLFEEGRQRRGPTGRGRRLRGGGQIGGRRLGPRFRGGRHGRRAGRQPAAALLVDVIKTPRLLGRDPALPHPLVELAQQVLDVAGVRVGGGGPAPPRQGQPAGGAEHLLGGVGAATARTGLHGRLRVGWGETMPAC